MTEDTSRPETPEESAPSVTENKKAVAGKKKAGMAGKPRGKSPEGTTTTKRPPRLQQVLASAGLGSRRECEELIVEGRVEIDGVVADKLGTRVDVATQKVLVDGEPLRLEKLLYFVVNKPVGVVSTSSDPDGRMRVIDLIKTDARVYNVGRLDRTSEGLILVTNDGELANRLTHPKFQIEKRYLVEVEGMPEREALEELEKGVHLAEGFAKASSVVARRTTSRGTILEITLKEGRNREIRRLLARIGHKVYRLKRIAIGPLVLGDLASGEARRMTTEEVELIKGASRGKKGGAFSDRRERKFVEDSMLSDFRGHGKAIRKKNERRRESERGPSPGRAINRERQRQFRGDDTPARDDRKTRPRYDRKTDSEKKYGRRYEKTDGLGKRPRRGGTPDGTSAKPWRKDPRGEGSQRRAGTFQRREPTDRSKKPFYDRDGRPSEWERQTEGEGRGRSQRSSRPSPWGNRQYSSRSRPQTSVERTPFKGYPKSTSGKTDWKSRLNDLDGEESKRPYGNDDGEKGARGFDRPRREGSGRPARGDRRSGPKGNGRERGAEGSPPASEGSRRFSGRSGLSRGIKTRKGGTNSGGRGKRGETRFDGSSSRKSEGGRRKSGTGRGKSPDGRGAKRSGGFSRRGKQG